MAKVYDKILNALKKLKGKTVDVPELANKLNMDASYIYKVIKENPELKINTTAPSFGKYSKAELNKGAKYYKYSSFKKAPENTKMLIKYFIRKGEGKFKTPDKSTQFQAKFFKDYTDADFLKDLKNKKDPYKIAREYYEKNKAYVKKELTGNAEYTRPIGYLNKILKNRRRANPEIAEELKIYKDWSNEQKPPRTLKEYTKKVEELIPLAKERKIIPENINTSEQYFRFVKKQRIDPLMRLFNNLEKIGVEHIGGIARAVDLTDVKTLQEVVPILGGEKVNKAKGLKYDRPMTGLVQNIIRSDIPEAQEKSLKALNLMGKRAGKEFGVPVSSYELTDEGLKRISSGRTLQDTLFEDAKSLIKKQVVPQGGSKRELFKNYPVYTQNAIKAVEAGDNALFIKNLKAGLLEAVEASPTSCKAFFNKAVGGPSLNCIDTINQNPVKAAEQLAETKATSAAVGKVKNVAKSFLNILGKGKGFAIGAGLGVGGGALVKKFMNDDPSTYLTNDAQANAMILDTLDQKEREQRMEAIGDAPELLNEARIGGELAVTGAAIPGASSVYQARRKPFTRIVDGVKKTRPAMGPARAALGPVGKALSGFATPLGIAALTPLNVASSLYQGDSGYEIATDPLNYLAPALAGTMGSLSKEATRGMGATSKLAKTLRLGMSPGAIKMISRRFGLPGLALSSGISLYELADEYKSGRGMFGKKE